MQNNNSTYDIIIAGGGLSGLTLAVALVEHAFFKEKKIAIIERDAKESNDRTWCFWAKADEPLPDCIHRSWPKAFYGGPDLELHFDMHPYQYHMVRSSEFYAWAKQKIAGRVDWISDEIQSYNQTGETVTVKGKQNSYAGRRLFNSAFLQKQFYQEEKALLPKHYFSHSKKAQKQSEITLLQHFKGYYIKTEHAAFSPEKIHLMDFRIDQMGETRFFYVLPFSEHEALVEFTLFSPSLLEPEAYDSAIHAYLKDLWDIESFEVTETEFGVIPMSNYKFKQQSHANIYNIGTAGGYVKASSGYTFLRTQRKIQHLVQQWALEGKPPVLKDSAWKAFMDSILLKVLEQKSLTGAEVFTALFIRCKPAFILRFLDEDTSIWEDFQIIFAMPKVQFTKAALQYILGRK